MRIAIYHNLPSGGAKRSLFEMTRRLAQKHEVDVFTLSCAEHEFADVRSIVDRHEVTEFAPLDLLDSPFGRANQLIYLVDLFRLNWTDRQIARQIDEGGYDVAFVHHCRYRQSPALMRYLQTPVVYYCQEPPRKLYDPTIDRPYDHANGWREWFDRLDPLPRIYQDALRRHDQLNVQSTEGILVNSYYSRENVWRVYGKSPMVCYLGVDAEAFQPVDCERERIVLSVGTINRIKGHDLLLKALARLPQSERPGLVIISNFGEEREKAYLKELAERYGVYLRIRPIINESRELATWYSRALVTGYTPVLEPLGLVALESMACETPVVGVREGGVRETVLDGVTGRLVDRDPEAVAEALRDLLDDRDQAAEMGRRGRTWVTTHWTWDQTAAKVEKALAKAAVNAAP